MAIPFNKNNIIFSNINYDDYANSIVSGFIINKIKKIVKNPSAQKNLIDLDYPFGSKRPALDTSYYKTFNQNNVEIINLKSSQFQSVSASGLTINNKHLMLDMIIFATGFDAITGSLLNMDITGANKKKLSSEWHKKPNSYLGLQIPNFPNLFTITGPGSPSVLTNMPRAIEQHVDWITNCISNSDENKMTAIPSKVGLVLLGIYWFGMTALVVNNFTRTNCDQLREVVCELKLV